MGDIVGSRVQQGIGNDKREWEQEQKIGLELMQNTHLMHNSRAPNCAAGFISLPSPGTRLLYPMT